MRIFCVFGVALVVVACGGRSELDVDFEAGGGASCNAVSPSCGDAFAGGDEASESDDGPGAAPPDASPDTAAGTTDAPSDAPAAATDAPGDDATSPAAIASTYLVNPGHTSSILGAGVKPPLQRAWTATFGGAVSYPLIANGIVYVATNGARAPQVVTAQLVALDASSGSVVWKADLGSSSAATIAYDGGHLFAIIDDDLTAGVLPLRSYDAASGALEWTAKPDNQSFFDAPPVAYRGILYVSGLGTGGTLYAYDETRGTILWRQNTEGSEGSPAVSADGVFFSDGCQNVVAFDRVSGAQLWRHMGTCSGGGGTTPVIYGHALYVHDMFGDFVLDATTGTNMATPFTSTVSPALDGTLLVSVAGSTMSAGDAIRGGTTWTFSGDGRLASSPLAADGYVYVGSSTGNVYAVREDSGLPIWSENTGYPLVWNELFTTEPRVAFAAGDGLLLVPAGSTLIAYSSASTVDGGMSDASTDAGCTWSMTPVTPPPGTGELPASLATGDMNHDGHPDLVVAHTQIDSAGILLGNGDGTFGSEALYKTKPGSGSNAVALGDFDGDGNLDAVVANPYSGYSGPYTVSVFLGLGDGTLKPRVDYPTGKYPVAVAVADLNGDARLDLAVVTEGLSVMLGNGDGTFQAAVTYSSTSAGTDDIAVADFNADGALDVAISDQSTNDVAVMLGNGDGSFRPAVLYAVGNLPYSVAIGDVNGDGKKDLAVANGRDDTVSILLGAGDGTFQAKGAFATGARPTSVGIADLNGDGRADLAVANDDAATVSILLGNGDGTFQQQFVYGTKAGPVSLAIHDLNGDGWSDLAIADEDDNAVSVFLGGCR
jgi:outer membrane protein assembly factor BamB